MHHGRAEMWHSRTRFVFSERSSHFQGHLATRATRRVRMTLRFASGVLACVGYECAECRGPGEQRGTWRVWLMAHGAWHIQIALKFSRTTPL